MTVALTAVELCAGGGGQALGLEQAGFQHLAMIENDNDACSTLKLNRPAWDVIPTDLRRYNPDLAVRASTVDLLAGGVPCTPYSIAGRQHGTEDDRDLLPEALRLTEALMPRAVLIENVNDLLRARKFSSARNAFIDGLKQIGYRVVTGCVDAQNFGVPQRRERAIVMALREDQQGRIAWPISMELPPSVGEVLKESMSANGWPGVSAWAELANGIAPTLVGGSKKHGGADLGPDRAKRQWADLCVNGNALAESAPDSRFVLRHGVGRGGRKGYPKITTEQAALIQGFPLDWKFVGSKTARYRQIGNAFPPPVARALGRCIATALRFGSNGPAP